MMISNGIIVFVPSFAWALHAHATRAAPSLRTKYSTSSTSTSTSTRFTSHAVVLTNAATAVSELQCRGGSFDPLPPSSLSLPSPGWPRRNTEIRKNDEDDDDGLVFVDSTTTRETWSQLPQYQQQEQPYEEPYEPNILTVETEQERVERWKNQQREHQLEQQQPPPPPPNIVPASSSSSSSTLLASVSRGSRVFLFFLLLWRDLALFEMADLALKPGPLRSLLVTPLVVLFIANLMGALTLLFVKEEKTTATGHYHGSSSAATKRRLKAILNADKMVEAILLVFYVFRLTLFPSKYTPREIYLANMFHSVLFLLQCQAFTRLSWNNHTWDDKKTQPAQPQPQLSPNYGENQPWATMTDGQQQEQDPSDNYNNNYYSNPQDTMPSN